MKKIKDFNAEEYEDLNAALRNAFRPLSKPINISDDITLALIILTNLTEPIKKQKNLFDKSTSKEMLRCDKWWASCITAFKYRQSHNVKFPDIRAQGSIRIQSLTEVPPYLLSSVKLPTTDWCYAHDSKYMNTAVFFTSEFIWEDKITCLGDLLSDFDHPIWQQLKNLGCYQKTQRSVSNQLKKISKEIIDVDLTSNYLSQISLPDNKNSYISLSPVVSQTMQADCYQSLEGKYRVQCITRYSRATNMGVLPMTCGGAIRMIRSFPQIGQKKHNSVNNTNQWLNHQRTRAMQQYLSSYQWLSPITKIKIQRKLFTNEINQMIRDWLMLQPDSTLSAQQLTESLNYELSLKNYANRFAYEPKLTRLFKNQITGIKNTYKESKKTDSQPEGSCLTIPNLRVCSANAMSTPYSIGLPSLMAFFGFIHAFERRVKNKIANFKILSFAICIHTAHVENRGLTKEPVQKNFPKQTDVIKISTPATYDNWQCDLQFSLILHCDKHQHLTSEQICQLIPKRFARGNLSFAINNIHNFIYKASEQAAIESIPETIGQWITSDTAHSLSDFKDIIAVLENDHKAKVNCLGYALLETPHDKPGSLRSWPHALCEAVIAITKLSTINNNTNLDSIFWEYELSSFGPMLKTRKSNGTTN
ncbi:CRISPR-associated protein Csy2 [Moritella sp. 24]|uniref:type I-F CRISPR-associated protein Csy2 n=1 Tax=Moritella sp. 24 TaxID=2746230 RepID=UPI001BA68DF2|nr:type I-F CRISPR-associated protein Csy2 [Moritella sp. 24]QUM76170.1 CRISPR-associated protein Csy2 [Moritella sp. 24]